MDKVHHLISDRWSPVAFDDQAVDYDKIQLLFEAAKWAPSGRNAQPWRFIIATREMSDYKVLLDLLDKPNQVWASTAPLLVLPLAQVISIYKNRPNRLAFYETGMAVGNLLAQATAMGLMVHQMGGYDVDRAKETLVIPTRYEPTAMMAIGYKGDPARLPKKVAAWEERQRTRMEISKFLVQGKCK
ncbi:MAG: nitroreductase family protein [Bacteroidales bacterium]|nr:nitroreductase family protein [Bacteroidales bacterium]